MEHRIGLGPVFAYEWLTQTRRPGLYAFRFLFGLGLLIAMAVVVYWSKDGPDPGGIAKYAEVGRSLFYGLAGMEIALVLLVAPAATAGAICLERQRGSLAHLLMTDLSSAEIILGKLAARITPAVGLILAALPISAMALMLGGIDPTALFGAFLISIGVTVLGCALALAISIWAGKTHEVLLLTYAIIIGWLMLIPLSRALGWASPRGRWSGPDGLEFANPFYLAFRPYSRPLQASILDPTLFLLGSCLIAALLVVFSIGTLRKASTRTPRPRKAKPAVVSVRTRKDPRLWSGPSLDGNPVLWREWHRSRPSKITATVWSIALGIYIVFAGITVVDRIVDGSGRDFVAVWTNGFGATIVLLLVSITVATSLMEERVRGSLDVLLSTPLSTLEIVKGKWWGAFRKGLIPVIPMTLIAVALAARSGVWYGPFLLLGYYFSLLSLIVSLGLWLATLTHRPGWAIAGTVTAYLTLTLGVFFMFMIVTNRRDDSFWAHASPFFSFVIATVGIAEPNSPGGRMLLYALPFWSFVFFGVAVILFVDTVRGFDGRLGRVSETRILRAFKPLKSRKAAMVLD